ncbi:MAG TPA: hypothetical protein VF990_12480 [Candidatus Dormibacteraeota bacterium]
MDVSLPTVVDLPDGSFELRPDSKSARQLKLVLGYYALVSTGLSAAFVVWALTQLRIPWLFALLPLVVSISIDLFGWYVIRQPVLKADPMEVKSVAPMFLKRMPRSDLALIYRGQYKERDRKGTWVKYYLFVARDGKIGLKAPALAYLPEGAADFAQRLGVPLRGDFSEKVGDTVDMSEV